MINFSESQTVEVHNAFQNGLLRISYVFSVGKCGKHEVTAIWQ